MKISFIGSGNVATHLAKAFYQIAHIDVLQILSRNKDNAWHLAQQVSAQATNNLSDLDQNYDLLIIAVNDDAIKTIVNQLRTPIDKLVVHTAGSLPLDILDKVSNHFGVFYPLQTFSRDKKIDWSDVPILIAASSKYGEERLKTCANYLSNKTAVVDDHQRFAIHLAAVIACNFSNAIWTMAHNICTDNQIDFKLLKPLIEETVSKIWKMNPQLAQTGPAVRNDQLIMRKHRKFLIEGSQEEKIYSLLSQFIIKQSTTDS